MTSDKAFQLFREMITQADEQLHHLTLNPQLSITNKADKSVVTECDKRIDEKLTSMTKQAGLEVVSEEGEHVLQIIKSGNYLTIDPIDGTLGYIEYVNHALESGSLESFLNEDLGAASDFCLLLGIVENGKPRFGACYNFITKETILIDAKDKTSLFRQNNVRNYQQKYAVYVDQRPGEAIETELTKLPEVSVIKQAALGLKSLYTKINPHEAAITVHKAQTAGLWDIMPAAVATQALGGQVYDDLGNKLKLTDYVILPGKGATIIKGERFQFVLSRLKS